MLPLLLLASLTALAAAKCGDDLDCSLNGQCVASTCVCNPAWEGADCGRLVLLPAGAPAFGAGSGGNFSSWGGGVLQVEGSYHMFASVMANECGLNTWTTNSFIQHAVSDSPLGPFQPREVVRPTFSHNPTPVYDHSSDSFLVYHIAGKWVNKSTVTNCSGGVTPGPHPRTGVADPSGLRANSAPARFTGTPQISHSKAVDGPWTTAALQTETLSTLAGWNPDSTDNPAPWIFPNGSVMLLFRSYDGSAWGTDNGTLIGRATAEGWNRTYTHDPAPIISEGNEDPFLWVDRAGHFHALLHGEPPHSPDAEHWAGRHMCSRTGLPGTWIFSPTAAYTSVVQYRNGSSVAMYRRERPHLPLSKTGEPEYLYTSAQPSKDTDLTFTLVQRIQQTPLQLRPLVV